MGERRSGLWRAPRTSEYNAEMLAYKLELERTWIRPGDYLSSHPEIDPWARDKLVKWVCDLCRELRMSAHSTQLTLTILSIFLSKVRTPRAVLQLVGTASVMIIAKSEEGISFPLERAFVICARTFQKQDFITAELFCLEKLEWRLYYPTAAEIVRLLIYVTGVSYDFARIIGRADDHCLMCYLDYRLSQFSPLSIAIICTVVALEQFKQVNFRNQWLQFLYLKVQLKVEELDQFKSEFHKKIDSLAGESEKGTLKLVSKNSFSTLLALAHEKQVPPR